MALVGMGQRSPGDRHRVLIVLSDPAEERIIREAFEGLGWDVRQGDTLMELHEQIAQDPPQVAVVDSLVVLRVILSTCGRKTVSVAFICDDREAAGSAACRAGAELIVPRPIDPDDPLGWETLQSRQ